MLNRTFCEFCEKPLPSGSRSSARFCSVKCKQAAYRRRADPEVGTIHREAERIKKSVETKASTSIERTCAQCGQHLNRTVAQANAQYCNAACKQKAYRQRQRSAEQEPASAPSSSQQQRVNHADANASVIDALIPGWGEVVRIDKPGDANHGKVGKIMPPLSWKRAIPAGHEWVELVSEHADGEKYEAHYHVSHLRMKAFRAGAGPQGMKYSLDRMSVAYRHRYGHAWMYEGGVIAAKADGYYLTVDGRTFFLGNHKQAEAHLNDYYNRGVSNQAMLRAR